MSSHGSDSSEDSLEKYYREHPGPIEFSPAFPPIKPNYEEIVECRLALLKENLRNPMFTSCRDNILAILGAYERNEVKEGDVIYAQFGKLCDKEPEPKAGSSIWVEGMFHYQFMQQAPAFSCGRSHGAVWTKSDEEPFHKLPLAMRIPTDLGGDDDRICFIDCVFDTGSSRQTIRESDLATINFDPRTYSGFFGVAVAQTANGRKALNTLKVEIRVVDTDFSPPRPMTFWMDEWAAIVPDRDPFPRLSGTVIYENLFFGLSSYDTNILVAGLSNHAISTKLALPTAGSQR